MDRRNIATPDSIKKIIQQIEFPEAFGPNQYISKRDKDGFKKPEHRIVWSNRYGPIPSGAVIHHINGNKRDNRIENLMLFQNANAHMNHHKIIKKKK